MIQSDVCTVPRGQGRGVACQELSFCLLQSHGSLEHQPFWPLGQVIKGYPCGDCAHLLIFSKAAGEFYSQVKPTSCSGATGEPGAEANLPNTTGLRGSPGLGGPRALPLPQGSRGVQCWASPPATVGPWENLPMLTRCSENAKMSPASDPYAPCRCFEIS